MTDPRAPSSNTQAIGAEVAAWPNGSCPGSKEPTVTVPVPVPAGYAETAANGGWRVYATC